MKTAFPPLFQRKCCLNFIILFYLDTLGIFPYCYSKSGIDSRCIVRKIYFRSIYGLVRDNTYIQIS